MSPFYQEQSRIGNKHVQVDITIVWFGYDTMLPGSHIFVQFFLCPVGHVTL